MGTLGELVQAPIIICDPTLTNSLTYLGVVIVIKASFIQSGTSPTLLPPAKVGPPLLPLQFGPPVA